MILKSVAIILAVLSLWEFTWASKAAANDCSSIFQTFNPSSTASANRRIVIDDFSTGSFTSETLTTTALIGKIVDVRFPVDVYGNPLEKPDLIPQKIHTLEEMDTITHELVGSLKTQSLNTGRFRETSGWLIYSKAGGAYRSEIALGHDIYISHDASMEVLGKLIGRIRGIEGDNFKIDEIEFFHSHFKSGEPFNLGDVESHDHFWGLYSGIFNRRGLTDPEKFTSYAVPVEGETFYGYRSSYSNR